MATQPLIGFRVEPELLKRIEEQARVEHRSRCNLLQVAVRQYVERNAEQGAMKRDTQSIAPRLPPAAGDDVKHQTATLSFEGKLRDRLAGSYKTSCLPAVMV